MTKQQLKVFSKSELIQYVLDMQKDLNKCIAKNAELVHRCDNSVVLTRRKNK